MKRWGGLAKKEPLPPLLFINAKEEDDGVALALALALALAASTDMDLLPPYPQTAQYTVHKKCPLSLGEGGGSSDFALLHENG